jgi:hypothetical protein
MMNSFIIQTLYLGSTNDCVFDITERLSVNMILISSTLISLKFKGSEIVSLNLNYKQDRLLDAWSADERNLKPTRVPFHRLLYNLEELVSKKHRGKASNTRIFGDYPSNHMIQTTTVTSTPFLHTPSEIVNQCVSYNCEILNFHLIYRTSGAPVFKLLYLIEHEGIKSNRT